MKRSRCRRVAGVEFHLAPVPLLELVFNRGLKADPGPGIPLVARG